MLGKKLNKVYAPHLKTGLGYETPERFKKAIKAQPKMYDGEKLESNKLKVDLIDYEKTLEDAEKSRLKMKDKRIPLDYSRLNALYELFVPQTEISAEQTYFSSSSTSNVSPESSSKKSDLPPKKMPNESQLLKLFVNLDNEIKEFGKRINIHHKMDEDSSFIYDNKAGIRRLFTIEVVPISRTLNECSKEIKQELTVEVEDMLEIFESMERNVDEQSQKDELFQNEIDRLLEAFLEREVKDIGKCNNMAVLPNIPCPRECRNVGQLLVDHALSYALTATTDVPVVYIQQFRKTVKQVPNHNETIRFMVD
ncbi:hypothetical protein Tco_1175606 [Tanacetum coccineum]